MEYGFYKATDTTNGVMKTSYRIVRHLKEDDYAFVVKLIIIDHTIAARSFKVWKGDFQRTVETWSTKAFTPTKELQDKLSSEYIATASTMQAVMDITSCGLRDDRDVKTVIDN